MTSDLCHAEDILQRMARAFAANGVSERNLYVAAMLYAAERMDANGNNDAAIALTRLAYAEAPR